MGNHYPFLKLRKLRFRVATCDKATKWQSQNLNPDLLDFKVQALFSTLKKLITYCYIERNWTRILDIEFLPSEKTGCLEWAIYIKKLICDIMEKV